MDSNLTFSLLKLMDCFLGPYKPREVSFVFKIFKKNLIALIFKKKKKIDNQS
jgi:hypothetical protein